MHGAYRTARNADEPPNVDSDLASGLEELWISGGLGAKIGTVVVLVVGIMYCFYTLGHTADAYFTPALQVCCMMRCG